jgi:hypothetical protein
MIRRLPLFAILTVAPLLAQSGSFDWHIPKPFPRPVVPAGNPMNLAKVELGRYLFYEKRMSSNGNPTLSSLEEQAKVPMFGTDPVELGLKGHEDEFLRQIAGDGLYQRLFPQSFPDEKPLYTIDNVTRALAAFERTIVSVNSAYDRYRYDNETNAISDAAKRGEILFFPGSERVASSVTEVGTSTALYDMTEDLYRASSSKTPVCTTFAASSRTRFRILACTSTQIVVKTSGSSEHQPCAMSR